MPPLELKLFIVFTSEVSLPYSQFLGYDRGEDGLPKVNESEAETVRLIYQLFLEGKTPHGIAKILTDEGIPTPGGKTVWQPNTVLSILKNEKYEGHALLQIFCSVLIKKYKHHIGENGLK